MSRARHAGIAASQRMLRVGEVVRHALSEVITRGDIIDPDLSGKVITVPEVKMSPDLKLATVFIMPLGGHDAATVIQALDRHKKYLRIELAQRINMKFAPDIRFKPDTSFERGAKIDAILASPQVRKDVGPASDENGA